MWSLVAYCFFWWRGNRCLNRKCWSWGLLSVVLSGFVVMATRRLPELHIAVGFWHFFLIAPSNFVFTFFSWIWVADRSQPHVFTPSAQRKSIHLFMFAERSARGMLISVLKCMSRSVKLKPLHKSSLVQHCIFELMWKWNRSGNINLCPF